MFKYYNQILLKSKLMSPAISIGFGLSMQDMLLQFYMALVNILLKDCEQH